MEEFLTVAAVARRLGVASATLRTWDRRYGLGPSHHEAGAHRRYSMGDLARLTVMRRLITTGVAPSEAAETALAHEGEITLEALLDEPRDRSELVETLYRAAFALDPALIEELIFKEIREFKIIRTWEEILLPLLKKVGENWAKTGKDIEIEHLLSEIILKTLRFSEVRNPINPRPVLLAAVRDEQHTLPLYALAAALAERNIEAFFLGARTPLSALSAMITRAAPPAIFLWALGEDEGDGKFFRDIPVVRPAPRIILGGPGWNSADYGSITHVMDLQSACEQIEQAIGWESPR